MLARHWLSGLVPVAALLLSACGRARHDSTEAYFLVATNIKIAYWKEAADGLADAARHLGVKCDVAGPESYDPKAEREALLQLAARVPKPAGILVSAANPALMCDAIDRTVAAGIPVVTMDSDCPSSKRLLFIGTQNYNAGQMGGELLAKELKGKGTALVYTNSGQENLDERLEGYKRALSHYTGIKLSDVIDIHGEPTAAFDSTQKLVQSGRPLPDAFICLEALACQEVAEVLDRDRINGKVLVAMDTNRSTLEWISRGRIAATIAQKPYTMAYYGLRILDDFYHHRIQGAQGDRTLNTRSPVPMFIDTGATLIDKTNVKALLDAGRPAY